MEEIPNLFDVEKMIENIQSEKDKSCIIGLIVENSNGIAFDIISYTCYNDDQKLITSFFLRDHDNPNFFLCTDGETWTSGDYPSGKTYVFDTFKSAWEVVLNYNPRKGPLNVNADNVPVENAEKD